MKGGYIRVSSADRTPAENGLRNLNHVMFTPMLRNRVSQPGAR